MAEIVDGWRYRAETIDIIIINRSGISNNLFDERMWQYLSAKTKYFGRDERIAAKLSRRKSTSNVWGEKTNYFVMRAARRYVYVSTKCRPATLVRAFREFCIMTSQCGLKYLLARKPCVFRRTSVRTEICRRLSHPRSACIICPTFCRA